METTDQLWKRFINVALSKPSNYYLTPRQTPKLISVRKSSYDQLLPKTLALNDALNQK